MSRRHFREALSQASRWTAPHALRMTRPNDDERHHATRTGRHVNRVKVVVESRRRIGGPWRRRAPTLSRPRRWRWAVRTGVAVCEVHDRATVEREGSLRVQTSPQHSSLVERRALGRAARKRLPRTDAGVWDRDGRGHDALRTVRRSERRAGARLGAHPPRPHGGLAMELLPRCRRGDGRRPRLAAPQRPDGAIVRRRSRPQLRVVGDT